VGLAPGVVPPGLSEDLAVAVALTAHDEFVMISRERSILLLQRRQPGQIVVAPRRLFGLAGGYRRSARHRGLEVVSTAGTWLSLEPRVMTVLVALQRSEGPARQP